MIERELEQRIVIKEGGRPRELSRREVIAKQLVKKAMEGHDRSIVTILKLVPSLAESFGREAAAAVARRTVLGTSTEDAAIIASFCVRWRSGRRMPPIRTSRTRLRPKTEETSHDPGS